MTEKPTGREIKRDTEEPVEDSVNFAEGKKKHIPSIFAPKRVIAGKPFEVIVTITGIPEAADEVDRIESIELYLQNKLVGRKELIPPTDEESESIFKVAAEEVLLAIKEIETCAVNGVNITCGKGEKSVITNLHVLVNCNIHGFSEASREIEVLSGEFEGVEEIKDVFVKPEDDKEYMGSGP